MAKPLGVGLVGYRFMGKVHSHAYHDLGFFFNPTRPVAMRAICGRTEEAVKAAAAKWKWESYETDYRKLIARDDIDIIDISSPGDSHVEIALAAAAAGKHILCEKPLANTLADAKKMLTAVREAGVKHMVGFNCRKIPSVILAKKWISEGLIGEPYLFRGAYLQDWIVDPDFPLVWRLDKSVCGSGALGDLAAHTIDLAHYLVGDIGEVSLGGVGGYGSVELPLIPGAVYATVGGAVGIAMVTQPYWGYPYWTIPSSGKATGWTAYVRGDTGLKLYLTRQQGLRLELGASWYAAPSISAWGVRRDKKPRVDVSDYVGYPEVQFGGLSLSVGASVAF